jgi:hypothetical protein
MYKSPEAEPHQNILIRADATPGIYAGRIHLRVFIVYYYIESSEKG